MARTSKRRSYKAAATRSQRLKLFLPGRSWRLQIIALAACVAAVLASQSFASAREAAATYLIQPGDTLLAIAGATGVPMDRIVSLNALQNPDMIIAGKTLQLQGAEQAAAAAATTARYTVKSGDTLWDIARANGVTLDALIKVNSLDDADRLKIGQQLALPEKPTARQAPPKPNPLQQKIIAEAERVAGTQAKVGVAAINLVSGERISVRGDESFPSASVMKLPILVELERQVAAGSLSWNDSLRTDAAQMIAVSDNAAANRIADRVSMVAVNDEMRKLGLGSTKFLNTFTDARAPTNPGQNQTTPNNMAKLLEMVATDQMVSPAVSGEIRGLLARNADRSKLVRLLPAEARVAHKSGWYEGVANDVGIVTVERKPARWIVAVFTQNVADAETGNQTVAAISKAIYDAWAT
jgi:beta-lactamase class A